ncbi:MAG: DUF4831 family protein [Bacteroidales bacterium]
MRYIIASVFILAGLSWGCTGPKMIEYSTSAVHVSQASHPEAYTIAYSIPMTTLKIKVEASRVIVRRGPYYQYAEKYLGITDVPDRDEIKWEIDNIEIKTCQEADPDHYYLLKTNDRHVTNFFKLGDEGYILPVNKKQLPETESSGQNIEEIPETPLYTDLSIHPKVVEETRTVMRMVRQDTAFVNVPVMQRQSVTKSPEEKAAEAADLIFELRSNRFKLISGDLDLFPDGRALEVIIEEFARIEKEYLRLFTGKVAETKHEFTFDYTPHRDRLENGTEYDILFRISDNDGILQANDVRGRPVTLELDNEMKTQLLEGISPVESPGRSNANSLFYRIPDVARLQVSDGKNTIVSTRIHVNQYGRVVSVPADFLWE